MAVFLIRRLSPLGASKVARFSRWALSSSWKLSILTLMSNPPSDGILCPCFYQVKQAELVLSECFAVELAYWNWECPREVERSIVQAEENARYSVLRDSWQERVACDVSPHKQVRELSCCCICSSCSRSPVRSNGYTAVDTGS